MVSAFEIYKRAINNNVDIPKEFNIETLLENIIKSAKTLTNNYLFPEKAIYSPTFQKIIGAFYTEYPNTWYIRIDIVQHHIDGYCKLLQNYDAIQAECAKYGLELK